MTNKPKWSAGGFAQRVKMSEHRLWLVVEGRDHDRPHYENLIRALRSTRSATFAIRLAEQIELDGVAAGGKSHALALHDYFEKESKLASQNKAGPSDIVFMLDRDRDDFMETMRSSLHVFYTHGTDVEADILLNSDLWTAVREAYGIDSELSALISAVIPDPVVALNHAWREWLVLGLVALECGVQGSAPWGTMSRVNRDTFEEVDLEMVSAIRMDIEETVEPEVGCDAYDRAAVYVTDFGVRLLKGRWIARYIKFLVQKYLAGEVVRAKVPPDSVVDSALGKLRHGGLWTQGYEEQFVELLGCRQPASQI